MAKGQKRGNKEAKKPKSADGKAKSPKYMAAPDLAKGAKSAVTDLSRRK